MCGRANPARRILSALIVLAAPLLVHGQGAPPRRVSQPVLAARSARIIERQHLRVRDLNRKGVLDRYEEWRLTPATRGRDLLCRITPRAKTGLARSGTA